MRLRRGAVTVEVRGGRADDGEGQARRLDAVRVRHGVLVLELLHELVKRARCSVEIPRRAVGLRWSTDRRQGPRHVRRVKPRASPHDALGCTRGMASYRLVGGGLCERDPYCTRGFEPQRRALAHAEAWRPAVAHAKHDRRIDLEVTSWP